MKMSSNVENDNDLIKNAKLFIAVFDFTKPEDKKANITRCLEEGADINSRFKNNRSNTSLHIAVNKGEKEIVQFLLENGANTKCKNDKKQTALDIAKKLNNDVGLEIINIIEAHDKNVQSKAAAGVEKPNKLTSINVLSEKVKQSKQKRRVGTGGVEGQLYETKLLSLIYIRIYNKEFCLDSNVDGIGALDDIILRLKHEGKDIIIFLQGKHRKNTENRKITIHDLWKEDDDFSLLTYFRSYLEIRQKFDEQPGNNDEVDSIFRGRYEDLHPYYVLYTPASDDLKDKKRDERSISDRAFSMHKCVKDVICSGENSNVFQYRYDKKSDIYTLSKIMLVNLVRQMGIKLLSFIQETDPNNDNKKYKRMMFDKDIRTFHVVLAHRVVNVSEENESRYRIGSFRNDFFSSNEEFLIILKETLYTEAVKKKKLTNLDIHTFLQSILLDPCAETISKLIGNVITYNSNINRLEIIEKTVKEDESFKSYMLSLEKLQVMESDAKEAFEIAGQRELSFKFQLPLNFGNCDLILPENKVKAEKKLYNRAKVITDMVNKSTDKNIGINEFIPWIEDAIGNLLIFDEDTKLLKFNVTEETLEINTKILLQSLKTTVQDMESYRFTINVRGYPRVSFDVDEYEKCFAKDFLSNLWFYTCQAKEDAIDNIAAGEIKKCVVDKKYQSQCRDNAKAIFAMFHTEIQNWWKGNKKSEDYLTNKDKTIFENILSDLVYCPWLSVLNSLYIDKTMDYDIEFNEDAINCLGLDKTNLKLKIIETDVNILCSIKLIQYFNNSNDCTFVDLDFVLSLDSNSFVNTVNEINNTKINVLIILYVNTSKSNQFDKVKRLVQEARQKQVILVTNKDLALEAKQYFEVTEYENLKDQKNNLTNLVPASQDKLLETYFIFQGEKVRFDAVINAESKHLIRAEILLKIINNEDIEIGNKLSDWEYEEVEDCYVQRQLRKRKYGLREQVAQQTGDAFTTSSSVPNTALNVDGTSFSSPLPSPPSSCTTKSSDQNILKAETLDGLHGIVAIVTAPSMGKSTLLTHMSIQSKKNNPMLWIEKINLIQHVKQFEKWHEQEINIDIKETMRFICKAALTKNISDVEGIIALTNHNVEFDIDVINGELVLETSNKNHDLHSLELELFAHSYNNGKLVLLFDELDQMYLEFKKEIVAMLKCLATSKSGHRMWLSSRPCNDIAVVLENELGASSYSIEPLTLPEEKIYYTKFLKKHINLSELSYEQFRDIDRLFQYMSLVDVGDVTLGNATLYNTYVAAIDYFQSEIKHTALTPDKKEFRGRWNLHGLTLLNLVGVSFRNMSEYLKYFQHKVIDKALPFAPPEELKWDLSTCAQHYDTLFKKFKARLFFKNINEY